ncbi:cyclic nucleotide-degrading phosphodiesterase [Rhodococcus chondri]|uniref:Cyclic nucleotide-degrading phosphodiesterase n=1 Tax=Rhodococcus chondri TaxID=3065941 RepID=A0ABU7JS79_9NOCA|nr:cyclic nucleotide-degrading phosphodiesterase [Rhodococcus sp. CC-R104]MEE2032888.1 cyclic nucleotide-degrading phosphodiesterase [Rhodococcus sp. CC-R104]
MRMTVLGCSGSVAGPDSAASGYLLSAPGTSPLVIDFGPGVLGALQRHADPGEVSVLLSHLHADHCLDMPGLLVWRRYSPNAPTGRVPVYGPGGTAVRIGVASAETPGEIDDVSDTLDVRAFTDGMELRHGALTICPRRVNHPPEAYGFRVTSDSGRTLVYTGDTGMCDSVVELARGADVLLSEASWTHAPGRRPEGVHLSGTEAGQIAARAGVGELLLTHIPPWTSREDVIAEAKEQYSGPVHAVSAGDVYRV